MSSVNQHDYVRLALSHAVFVPNDDGSWTVEITVLPGCVTWGKTRAEAASMAEDAAEGWLLTALRFGDEIPVIDGFALNQVLTTGTQESTMVYESKPGAGGDLILRRQLPLDMADGIDPSVQPEYRRLWQQAQGGIQPDR